MLIGFFNGSDVDEVANRIIQKGEIVVLTGAGISTESGIPDFRSPDGIWSRYDFTEYATIDALLKNPVKVFGFFEEFLEPLKNAVPNEGHKAIASLEEAGLVKAVITQNIDNLHQKAGSKKVVELHGNALRARCLGCKKIYSIEDIEKRRFGFPPYCPDCNNLIKPDVILFGESLPEDALREAYRLASNSKLMMVVGTSGAVAPANTLPFVAKEKGADIIEINREPTIFTKSITDYFLQGRAGDILKDLIKKVLK